MPFGGLIRGILEKVHDSLLFPGRILLGIGKLTVFAYASAINFWGRCESSSLDAAQTALGIRESWVPGIRILLRFGRFPRILFVTSALSHISIHMSSIIYEQLQSVEAPITGMN